MVAIIDALLRICTGDQENVIGYKQVHHWMSKREAKAKGEHKHTTKHSQYHMGEYECGSVCKKRDGYPYEQSGGLSGLVVRYHQDKNWFVLCDKARLEYQE
eukprot:622397_1